MAILLFVVIYIAYIGLGIPDSLFGTAWPAIYAEFGLPISFAGVVGALICCGTFTSCLCSAKVIRRLGTARVSIISTAMTAFALLGYSFSGNFLVLCLCAIPLGLGAGAIDTALNNYISLYYSASQVSFLHCFYGIGVSLSPYLLSRAIDGPAGWRGGYRLAFFIQLGITLFLIVTLPAWKSARGAEQADTEYKTGNLSLKEIARIPGVPTMWCLFFTSCAIEWTCGGWGSTFLVEYKHMAAADAARMVMFFYIGMALGRFLSGVIGTRWDAWRVVRIAQVVSGAAIFLLLLPVPAALSAVGLFLVGLGVGPLFPNFSSLTPRIFGAQISPFVMGTQMAASSLGIMIAPPLCGALGQFTHMAIFPFYLLAFYLIMLAAQHKIHCKAKS